MRTLPGFQSIFMAFTDIKTFIESLNECIKDLQKTNLLKSKNKKYYLNKNNFKIKKNVTLKNISAKIDNKDLLKNINLNFEKNKIIGVIGKSGSGKSSLINIISGLIERNRPGKVKTGRQVLFSTDLIFEVLRKHEPNHILLQTVRHDAMRGLIDAGRLADFLHNLNGKIICKRLDRISPMAVPLILQITRENSIKLDLADSLLENLENEILKEANVEPYN